MFDNHRPHLSGRNFILVTDCSALTWLFMSHALSSKPRRWAVRLAKHYLSLQ